MSESTLTVRELEALCAVCSGKSVDQAAYDLFIEKQTLANHMTSVYRKLTWIGAIDPNVKKPRTPACAWLVRALGLCR